MESTQSFRFFNRGPSPMVRLVFFAVLSVLLLFVDARFRYLESTRKVLSIVVYPIQRVAAWPGVLLRQLGDIYITQSRQHSLIAENEALNLQHQADAAQLVQLEALLAENLQMRNLAELSLRSDISAQLVEITYSERDVFKRRVLVNKGENANIRMGQVVMDEAGIVGQVTRVYPWLSEIALITEKDHAVPIQVLRNGLRAIVFGSGDSGQLSLRYMPVGADVQVEDILVTSGIDGVYPPGIPVAKVIKVERDPAYPFATVTCVPVAGVDNHRHLLVLSTLPSLPERPAQAPGEGGVDKRAKPKRKN